MSKSTRSKSTRPQGIARRRLFGSLIAAAALSLAGCFQDDAVAPGDGPRPEPVLRCADLTPAQQKAGDSLVALAQKFQAGEVAMAADPWAAWHRIDKARIDEAIGYYDKALSAAPGHCGAVFGKSLAQAISLIEDQDLNGMISEVLPKAEQGGQPLAKAFKASRDEAAPLVLKVASGVDRMPKAWIARKQDYLAETVMPRLDTIIAALDQAMAKPVFAARFTRADGRPLEIDKGEVGPVLGGLKVARAVLLVLAGYQWEIAREGSYAFIDRLETLNPDAMRALSPAQKQALNHLTGLFQQGNAFTKVKPAWKTAVRGIPALLLEAVENTQDGLRYAISEAAIPGSQDHDLYRVGKTELDDVDPADLQGIIDALERTKKYLKGEAAFAYHVSRTGQATHTMQVNFPKVFAWDGVQGYLPYHKVLPYPEWVKARRAEEIPEEWSTSPFEGVNRDKVMDALELFAYDSYQFPVGPSGDIQVVLMPEEDGWFSPNYPGPQMTMATLRIDAGNPCKFRFKQDYTRKRVEPSLIFPSHSSFETGAVTREGVIDFTASCRVTPSGVVEFRSSEAYEWNEPFHFTDKGGAKTLGLMETEDAVERLGLAAALTGKVVFPDPTFGGVFPGLTNETIWLTVEALGRVDSREVRVCDDATGECKWVKPSDPTDLDLWIHYLVWVDDLL